jgi:hypothetical protein
MYLILWILRLLFGLHLDGSSRPLPVAVRPDGRTECHHGADWLWHWLQGCADWLKIRFWGPRPRGWVQRPGSGLVRGTAPPGTD